MASGGRNGSMVPPDLLVRLLRWQEVFEASFHYESGWSDKGVRDQWAQEAELLEKALRKALPPDVVLTVNLWPLDKPGGS